MTMSEVARCPLEGRTVVVTGDVPGFDRDQAEAAVVRLGGKIMKSVSGRTGLVVTGKGAGIAKMEKVRQHDLSVLSAEDFADLVADPSSWNGEPVGAPLVKAAPVSRRDTPAASAHALSLAVIYPGAGREIRLACKCGHRWLGDSIHDGSKGCPQDTPSS